MNETPDNNLQQPKNTEVKETTEDSQITETIPETASIPKEQKSFNKQEFAKELVNNMRSN